MGKEEKLTIIDGSSLIYSACHNMAKDMKTTDDYRYYREALDRYIQSILEDTKADLYVIYGDQNSSYRKRLFEDFKADRLKRSYLKFKNDLTQYANTNLGFYNHPDLEADDLCLLTHDMYKDKYNITIASKDSDLRQYSANFFNYGIYGKGKVEDGFENISEIEAWFNLWRSVLVKGHNNKLDYLEGCGLQTAESYLKLWKHEQYPYAVLKAFLNGIESNREKNIKREIKGYNFPRGMDKFNKSFQQTYLFRTLDEINSLNIYFYPPSFRKNPYSLW